MKCKTKVILDNILFHALTVKCEYHIALWGYPHVKWEIENLSQITTTVPILAVQLFQTKIFGDCQLRSFTFE